MIKTILQMVAGRVVPGENSKSLWVGHAASPSRRLAPGLGLFLFLLAFVLSSPASYAVDVYWRAEASNGNWDNGDCSEIGTVNSQWYYTGWGGNTSRNRPDCYGQHVINFDNGNQSTMTLNNDGNDDYEVNQVIFKSGTSARTISAASGIELYMQNSGAKIENQDGDGQSFSCEVNLDADTEINAVGGDLTFSGNVVKDGYILKLYGSSDKLLTFSGIVSGGGDLQIRPDGAGYHKVLISGASTYSGTTKITEGELWVGQGGTINGASAGAVEVGNSSYADDIAKFFISDMDGGTTVNETFTVQTGNGADKRVIGGINTSGTDTFSGAVTLNDEVTLYAASGGTVDFTANISGSQNVYKSGPGTVTFTTATKAYSGATYIEAGTLTVGSGGSMGSGSDVYVSSGASAAFSANTTVASLRERGSGNAGTASIGSGAALTINGASKGTFYMNSISGAGGLTLSGTGTTRMQLYGTQSYSGDTVINSVILGLQNGTTFSSPLIFIGTNATLGTRAGGLTFGSGQGITVIAGASASPATIGTASGKNLAMASNSKIVLANYNNANGAPLAVSGGGQLTLASGNSVLVTNVGSALSAGTYTLISGGAVGGTAPATVSVVGNGLGGGLSPYLSISGGNLILNVGAAPSVSTVAGSATNTTTATVNGNVTADGGASVTDRGAVYKTSSSVTISDNKTQSGTGTGAFSVNLSSLAVSTRYYFRAYAINTFGTTLGSELQIWTLANTPSAPTVAAVSTTSLSVDVNPNSNPSSTEYAIQETTSGNYVQTDGSLGGSAAWQPDATWGTKTVTGLSVNQQYTFQVKARNGENVETGFGSTASKYTLAAAPTAPTVAAVSSTSLSVDVNVNGNPAATVFAIREAGGQFVQTNGSLGATAHWQTDANWGTKTVTGLGVNQQYTFDVKAQNGDLVDTAYSSTAAKYTLAAVPSAPTLAAVSTSSVSVDVNVNGNPGATVFAIREAGGQFVQTNGALGATAHWQTDANWGTKNVTGLTPGQPYTFDVKAQNGDLVDTAYSSTAVKYALAAVPAAPTVAAVSSTSLSVDVDVNGNNSSVEYAIQETVSGNYVQGDGSLGGSAVWATDAGWGTKTVTGFSVNQAYTFQVKAKNGDGTETSFGSTASKYTLAIVPSAPTVDNPTASSLDVEVNANSNPTSVDFAIHESTEDLFVQADGTLGASAIWQTAATWGTITVIGLDGNTEYTFEVKARNDDSPQVETAYGTATSESTINTSVPVLTTPTVSSVTSTSATLGATVTSDGNDTITSRGTVWGTSAAPTGNALAEGGTAVSAFTHNRTVLTPGTLIYYRGYAINGIGTGYSADGSFWTIPQAPVASAATSIQGLSFQANWSAATGATNYFIDVSAASNFSTFMDGFQNLLLGTATSISVTGLTENTTYYWRLRAQNSGGTSTNSVTQTTVTAPVAPGASASTVWTVDMFDANWSSAAGATSYRLDVSSASDFSSFVTGWEDVNVGGVTTYDVDSDLSAGSVYYYRLRSVNGDGSTSTNSATITAYTLSAEPSGHVGSFAAAPATTTSIDLSWTAAAGPPSGYLILQRTGAAPTGLPDDGSSYTVSDIITDGTVAAIVTPGSGESATISSLSAGTTYHFVIIPFAWNGANTQTYNYRTASAPAANATTIYAEPTTQASALSFSLVGATGLTLDWTSGNGANRIVLAHAGAAVDSHPADQTAYTASATFEGGEEIGAGNWVVYSGSGNSVAVSGLSAATVYHFRVYEFNGSGVTANYFTDTATGNPASQATLHPGDTTWDGGGADDATLTDLNWAGNLYPEAGPASIMRFAGSTRATPDVTHAANSDFGSIYFNAAAAAFTVGGYAMDIFSLIQNDSGNLQTINNNLVLGAEVTLNAASGSLALGGALSGSYGLVKSGTHTATLSGGNSFTGAIALNAGVLVATHATALGTVDAGVSVASGAALQISGDIAVGAEALTLNGTGVSADGALRSTSGDNTYGGAITLGSSGVRINADADTLTLNSASAIGGSGYNLTLGGSGDVILSSAITTGAGTLTKDGSGTLTLTGANTYSGGTTISAGTLEGSLAGVQGNIVNNATLEFVESGAGTYAGDLSGTGAVIFSGSGTVTLSGGTISYSGATTVSAGKVFYNENNGSTAVTVSGGSLGGDGAVGSLSVSGQVNPGSADTTVGELGASSLTLQPGGSYRWDISDVDLGAGSGWDFINVGSGSGTINASANSGSKFTIYVYGDPADFDPSETYAWVIASGALSGFQASEFAVNYDNFTPGGTQGTWSLSEVSGDLVLNYLGFAAPPTAAASTLAVSSFGVTTMSLTWARGDGENVLVVARSADAVESPTDGTSYTANAAWGSAGTVGTASKAMYLGTGTSENLTDLTAATEYRFSAFEFNGTGGGENYLVAGAPVLTRYTLSTEPAAQVTGLDANSPSANAIDLDWTESAGSPAPDGYLVLRRQGTAPTSFPADGQAYSVNDTLGDGSVVAALVTGSSTTIGSLAPETTYHFAVVPFRRSLSSVQTYNYKTDSLPTDSDTTVALLVIKDQFDGSGYDDAAALNGLGGGTGWGANTWVASGPSGEAPEIDTGSKAIPTGYLTNSGNKVIMPGAGLGDAYTARRVFGEEFTSGKIYAAAVMSFAFKNTDSYIGLSLMDGTTEKAFMGAASGSAGEVFTLDSYNDSGSQTVSSPPKPFYGSNDKSYLVIIRYDFDTKKISGLIYRAGEAAVPAQEPETWDINAVDITGRITAGIDGIRLTAGGNGGSFQFDEVRVSDSWTALLGLAASEVDEVPNVQANNFTFSAVRTNQFSVDLAGGNGSDVLVVAREGATVAWTPTDGQTYTADPTYGDGESLGSGTYVIYNGSDANPTFTMDGLDPNTVYHLRAFEYNQASGTKYQTNTVGISGNPIGYSTLGPPVPTVGIAGTSATTLNWSPFSNNGVNRNVMVVYRVGSAVTFVPVDGTSYGTGAQGSDTILLADSADTFYSHPGLTAGNTVHYRFITRNGNYYSQVEDRSVTLTETAPIIYDGCFPLSGGINNYSGTGGTGWNGNWGVGDSYGDANNAAVWDSGSIPGDDTSSAAWDSDNKIKFWAANDSRDITATRYIADDRDEINSGTYYLSFRMNFQYGGDYNYAGLQLINSSGGDELFIGNVYGYSALFGLDDGTRTVSSESLSPGSGNDYIFVVKLVLNAGGNDVISASCYKSGSKLIGEEPVSWMVTVTSSVDNIDRVQLKAGADDGNQIGLTYFDEVRIGTDWHVIARTDGEQYKQMMEAGPVPELVYIGAAYNPTNSSVKTYITDAELNNSGDKIDIAVSWKSPYGVFLTNNTTSYNVAPDATFSGNGNVVPNWDPLAKSGGISYPIGLDALFNNFVGYNGATAVTSYYQNAFTGDEFTQWAVGDEFFITVSAQTLPSSGTTVSAPSGGNSVPYRRAITVNSNISFTVVDDDPNPPQVRGFDQAEHTDAEMLSGLTLAGEVVDSYSGVDESTLTFTLWNADTQVVGSANTDFTTRPADGEAREDWGDLGYTIASIDHDDNRIGSWAIEVKGGDVDNDGWTGDAQTGTNFFNFTVIDDDTVAPVASNFQYKGAVNYRAFWVETNAAILASSLVDGVGTNVRWTLTDGDMTNTGGHIKFAFAGLDAGSGLSRGTSGGSNSVMSFSVGTVITNNYADYSAANSSSAGAGVVGTSVWSFADAFSEGAINGLMAVSSNQVWLTIPDADDDRPNDRTALYASSVGWLTVVDDDTAAPVVADVSSVSNIVATGRPLHITTNTSGTYLSGASTNRIYQVNDGELNALSAANPLRVTLGVSDASGIHRGTTGATNMSLTIGSAIVGNVANWSATESTPNATMATISTNVWRFETLDLTARDALFTAQTNVVKATVPDRDHDRTGDQLVTTDQQYGLLTVIDDDTTGPTMGGVSLGVDDGLTEGVVISEYIEGSSNNKAVEIYNGTADDIDLAAESYAIRIYSNGSATPTTTFTLTGTLPSKGVFVLADDDANVGIQAQANQLSSSSFWNGDDVVAVVRGSDLVDVLGQIGTDPGDAWVSGAVSTQNKTLRRKASVVRGDVDGSDAFDPAVQWDVYDIDNIDGLGQHNISGSGSWTNSTEVSLTWNSAIDGSGVSKYRYSAPTETTTPPTELGHGVDNGTTTSATFNVVGNQGVMTGFVFAVDDDNDRSNDRAKGGNSAFIVRIDTTAPIALASVTNDISDATVDETSELKITWDPEDDHGIAAGRRADGEPLSPWDTYVVTYHELNHLGDEITTNVVTHTNGPANLATNTTSSMIISNMDFDSTFRVRIAGRDQAGNVGPMAVVTGVTDRFLVTQGLARATSAFATSNQVEVYWAASTNKVYDVLYVDSPTLQDNLTNSWRLMATVTNSMMWDNGGTGPDGDVRIAPGLNQSTIRFYRISRQDVWRTNYPVRRASLEIYAAKAYNLVPGENWLSLFALPDTCTVAYVLGTNRLQGGTAVHDSPKISWFSATSGGTSNQSGIVTSLIYLTSGGNWIHSIGDTGEANDKLIPTNQAFLLELPDGAPAQSLVVMGLVPTQAVVHAIAGNATAGTEVYHMMNYNFPQRMRIIDAGLVGSGLVGHNTRANEADEIRILKNRNGIGSMEQPRGRLRLNTAGTAFIFNSRSLEPADYVDGVVPSVANNFMIEPDDAVIVVRRKNTAVSWTNRPSYTAPGKNINP